jgi:hypothetical protein
VKVNRGGACMFHDAKMRVPRDLFADAKSRSERKPKAKSTQRKKKQMQIPHP